MGRAPCCEKVGLKRGRWTAEEDEILTNYIQVNGEGSWRSLPKSAGLLRCGKSCRLRWMNYLRTDVKRGNITVEEEETIVKLHGAVGNRWSMIAGQLPGRTDNEIKNYWNSHLRRKIYRFFTKKDLSTAIAMAEKAGVSLTRKNGRSATIKNKNPDSTVGSVSIVRCNNNGSDEQLLQEEPRLGQEQEISMNGEEIKVHDRPFGEDDDARNAMVEESVYPKQDFWSSPLMDFSSFDTEWVHWNYEEGAESLFSRDLEELSPLFFTE